MGSDAHLPAFVVFKVTVSNDLESVEAEVLHGSRRGTHIARPLRLDQNDADVVEWVHRNPSVQSILATSARYGVLAVVGSASPA